MDRFRLNRLGKSRLQGDLFGGLTAAIVALPLALAFGVASGAGPMAGLYGAICVGLFASLFGGTPAQISGPTGPMTIVMASVFTQFAGQPAVAFTVVLMEHMGCLDRVRETERFENRPEAVQAAVELLTKPPVALP